MPLGDDGHVEAAAVEGAKLAPGIALVDTHGLLDTHVATGGGELAQPDLLDRSNEGGGTAIHDRHFRAIELDDRIIDAKPAQGRHQMFDGGNAACLRIADNGAKGGGGDSAPMRGNLDVATGFRVLHGKHDARAGIRRMKRDLGRIAGMDTDALQRYGAGERGLPVGASFHQSIVLCANPGSDDVGGIAKLARIMIRPGDLPDRRCNIQAGAGGSK